MLIDYLLLALTLLGLYAETRRQIRQDTISGKQRALAEEAARKRKTP